jgi:hypothetical protein
MSTADLNLDFLKKENWPTCHNASNETTKNIHKWCGETSELILKLVERLTILEEAANNSNTVVQTKPLFSNVVKKQSNNQIKYNNDEINVINAITIENDDIKKRECSIIISGLPNSSGDNIEIDDEAKITNLFTAISFEKTKMKRFKRFTNEKDNGKPNLIMIELKNKEDRFSIMKAAKALKNNHSYEDVFINFDLTPAQRVMQMELNKKRKELNDKDKTKETAVKFYWGIRSNKIVKINKA